MVVSKLKIPAKFDDKDYLKKINALNEKYQDSGIRVDETYGCIPVSVIGNARPADELPDVSMDYLKKFIEEGKAYGIGLDYTMNSIWSEGIEFSDDGRKKIVSEIRNLVTLGVEKVSVSSPGIHKILRNNFKDLEITVSINNCVDSVHAVKRWEKERVGKIVLSRHINREFELLQVLRAQSVVELELLLNSMCNLHCSLHQYHNLINGCRSNKNGDKLISKYPQNQCIYNMLSNPVEMICSAWIRPEDVHFYEKMGFHSFKLDGRCLSAEDVLYTAEAYLKRYYEGNFFNLFDFYNDRQEQPFHLSLDNRELDGFLEKMIEKKGSCRLCGGGNTKCKEIADNIVCDRENMKKAYKCMIRNQLEGEVF